MAPTDRDSVRAYYASLGLREWERLEQPADGAFEFVLTTGVLERHLPENARILDIGGGPGRYALWLADQGHVISLGDLSPEQLVIARERVAGANAGATVTEIVEVDACDLSRWADECFDAALSLGPFYHLTARADRDAAARELARVVKPGGVVFVAFIPRYTFIRRTLINPEERRHLLDREWVRRLVDDGIFQNDVPGRFNSGYGVRPEDVEPFMAGFGFSQIELLAAEGLTSGGVASLMTDLVEEGGPVFEAALRLIAETAGDPALLGAANHLLYVGRRV